MRPQSTISENFFIGPNVASWLWHNVVITHICTLFSYVTLELILEPVDEDVEDNNNESGD